MNLSVSRAGIFSVFLSLLTILFGCTKISTTGIGSGLIPPVDAVNTRDTVLDVITKNEGFDTVVVGISDNHALGYITDDPVFGTTSASINFQLAPPYTPFSYGTTPDSLYLDSVVLCLGYQGYWGDSLTPLAFSVWDMDENAKFTNDSIYTNVRTFPKRENLTENGQPKFVDILKIDDPDTLANYPEVATYQVRIRLNYDFGLRLLHFDSLTLSNDSNFNKITKGFIVEPEQTGNALLLVNLLDSNTHLSLYYRVRTPTGFDTVTTRFSPNPLTSASSNTILRNYSGTSIPQYFPPNSDAQDSLLFIQTSPGTFARIKIPGLDSLPNVIVHRAELLMEQVPDRTSGADGYFNAPNLFVAAYSKDSMWRFAVPNDVTFTERGVNRPDLFGVLPKPKSYAGGTISSYNFELTRYVQGIVTRQDSVYDLIVWAPYNYYIRPVEKASFFLPIATPPLNSPAIGRVRLGGGNNSEHKMRLHIVYSPLK